MATSSTASYRARYLVGAGGTRCPVYRALVSRRPPAREGVYRPRPIEHEFPYEWEDPRCHLWFFRKGLPGYTWYVPKADGYLNCGVGGVAESIKELGQDIKSHWAEPRRPAGGSNGQRTATCNYAPKGYSYFLRDRLGAVRVQNAFLVGDAVGLATRDLGEGIGPAIASGQRAARSILTGAEYSLDTLDYFSLPAMIGRERRLAGVVERLLRRRFGVTAGDQEMAAAVAANGAAA